jgi:hypothetical protein
MVVLLDKAIIALDKRRSMTKFIPKDEVEIEICNSLDKISSILKDNAILNKVFNLNNEKNLSYFIDKFHDELSVGLIDDFVYDVRRLSYSINLCKSIRKLTYKCKAFKQFKKEYASDSFDDFIDHMIKTTKSPLEDFALLNKNEFKSIIAINEQKQDIRIEFV